MEQQLMAETQEKGTETLKAELDSNMRELQEIQVGVTTACLIWGPHNVATSAYVV